MPKFYYITDSDSLIHHGIQGQHWGVRRYQNSDGTWTEEGKKRRHSTSFYKQDGVLKKGSTLYRVALSKDDPTYFNDKYVSTNDADNAAWEQELIPAYTKRGKDLYALKYKTVKDLKVASETTLGKVFAEELLKNPEGITNHTVNAYAFLGLTPKNEISYSKAASVNIAAQTELGKKFIDTLLERGYDAVSDTHGRGVSNDPIIILNPDKNLKKISAKKYQV